ncbi:MAG TPA: peptidylprolyl isomerase [Smithella sp.]|nr:peptidylprolyl isomerase [Smithella sp.]
MMVRRIPYFLIMAIMISSLTAAFPVSGETKKNQTEEKVAVVNGVPIDRGEFDGEVFLIQRSALGLGKPLSCDNVVSIRREVLESMIRRELIYQAARKSGIKPDENTINKEINSLKQQFSSEAEYKSELSRRNIPEEILRARMIRNSSVQKYIEKEFARKVKVTDNEDLAYYEKNLNLFKQPLQFRVSQIFIQSDPKAENSRKQELRGKAEKILKNLKNDQDFAALAREYSDGQTRTAGGDLGYLRMGQTDKQFESKIFALKKGEITDIIETDYGFHIFKVTDIKPETILAFENVRDKIRQFLVEEKTKQEADLYAKKLREKAGTGVEIYLKEDMSPAKRS